MGTNLGSISLGAFKAIAKTDDEAISLDASVYATKDGGLTTDRGVLPPP